MLNDSVGVGSGNYWKSCFTSSLSHFSLTSLSFLSHTLFSLTDAFPSPLGFIFPVSPLFYRFFITLSSSPELSRLLTTMTHSSAIDNLSATVPGVTADMIPLYDVTNYEKCIGFMDTVCDNIGYLQCSGQPCNSKPMCEICAVRIHKVYAFRKHELHKGPAFACMLSSETSCNRPASHRCEGCSDLYACQECLEKHHHGWRLDHQDCISELNESNDTKYPFKWNMRSAGAQMRVDNTADCHRSLQAIPPLPPAPARTDGTNRSHPFSGPVQEERSRGLSFSK